MPILMLVGNGLSIDFSERVIPNHLRLNTRTPLRWKVPIKSEADADAFEVLAELGAASRYVTETQPHLSDFEKIRILSSINQHTPPLAEVCEPVVSSRGRWIRGRDLNRPGFIHPRDVVGSILRYQVRLFLNAAFTHYHDICASQTWRHWTWHKWFKQHFEQIGMLCSFNYDLIAEMTLATATGGAKPLAYLTGRALPENSLPLFKPHGSINFTIDPRAINVGGTSVYRGGNIFERNDTPIMIKTPNALHDPLLVSDIVLPLEYSAIAGFQYIRGGYNYVRDHGATFDHCVIAGLSYWECDRPEIDTILGALRRETVVTVCDPYPNQAMSDALKARFEQVRFNGVHPPFDI